MDYWAMARYDFGLNDEEFLSLTFLQFDLLQKRKEEEDRTAFLQAGIVAAATYNVWRGKGEPLIDPWKFVPGEKPRAQDPMEQAVTLRGFFRKHGKNV